jgi:hypothetical protein
MVAKLTRLTHKIAIQLHLVAESCTIRSSLSRRPVRKLSDTHSYVDLLSVESRTDDASFPRRFYDMIELALRSLCHPMILMF